MRVGRFWDRFYMSATAGQWVQGVLDRTYIETLREYDDVADFLGDFHLIMRDLKLGVLEEVFFVPETVLGVGYMVRNARGKRFELFWLGGDGADEDERGEHQIVQEDRILETLLERQMTENWFRVKVHDSDYQRSGEVVNHGDRIVDFIETGDILGGDEDEEAKKLPQWITDEEEKTAAKIAA